MNIPLPEGDDIYALGFDVGLERGLPGIQSNVVYDSIGDQTPAQVITLGGMMAGAANTFVAMDPTKGLWLGNAIFENAPFRVNMAGDMYASSGVFSGSITAVTGSIGGFVIGADYVRDAANSMGLASTVSAGDDVRFWAGDTFANRAIAPFRVTEAGALTATNIAMTTGTSGYLRGGATDYLTGVGFFLGYSGAAYKFSVGDPAGSYIGWDGASLTIIGNQVVVNSYTANGTWTKPTGAKSVVIQVWGGGGGGGGVEGGSGQGGGGGGGAYMERQINASLLGSTETVTVGAAVAGALNGVNGNFSSFGTFAKAYGGGGAAKATNIADSGGAGGGGVLSVGLVNVTNTGGSGGQPAASAASTSNAGAGGGGGGSSTAGGGYSATGGGGGGAGANLGGNSVNGGGGGGGGGSVTLGAGGTSVSGGAGGAGGASDTAGSDGVAPGGGGGGGSKTGGADKFGGGGARGQVTITTYL